MKVAVFWRYLADLQFWALFFKKQGSRSLIAISWPCPDCTGVVFKKTLKLEEKIKFSIFSKFWKNQKDFKKQSSFSENLGVSPIFSKTFRLFVFEYSFIFRKFSKILIFYLFFKFQGFLKNNSCTWQLELQVQKKIGRPNSFFGRPKKFLDVPKILWTSNEDAD